MPAPQTSTIASQDQITGIFERLIYGAVLAVAMRLVARGWLDADMAPYVAGGTVAALGSAYAWWRNRPKSVMQSAAAIVGEDGKATIVVASPEMAASTPGQNNIVSNTETRVISK